MEWTVKSRVEWSKEQREVDYSGGREEGGSERMGSTLVAPTTVLCATAAMKPSM